MEDIRFKQQYQENFQHDQDACDAQIEYERQMRIHDAKSFPYKPDVNAARLRQQIAIQHKTTVDRMKKHDRCAEQVLGPDPTENIPYQYKPR